jgi:hypothetical protein
MYHPRIIQHYTYRVTECQSRAIDACVDVAQYEGINVHALAAFLRAIGAPRAPQLSIL